MNRVRRVTKSVRFRLTAWYAVVLIAILLAIGLSFSWFLDREMRQNIDQRIERNAREIAAEIDLFKNTYSGEVRARVPEWLFKNPQLFIQIVDANGNIAVSSESLNSVALPVNVKASGERGPVFGTFESNDVNIRSVHLPIFLKESGQQIGAVNVGEPLVLLDQTVSLVRNLLLISGAFGIALAAIAGYFLAGRALRPIDRMTATAASIASDTSTDRLQSERLAVVPNGDELSRLAATFNLMLDRLAVTFERQRRFIADASHELRTPLTALRGNVDVLARQADAGPVPPDELNETLVDLRRETRRMTRLVEDLLVLARTESVPAATFTPVRLDQVGADAVRTARSLADGQLVTLESAKPVWVSGDEGQLLQAAVILLDNAIRHTPPTGTISLAVSGSNSRAMLSVRDTGSGIAPDDLPRLFDRFYRADESRERETGGTGLGLAIAQAVVTVHRGSIEVASTVGEGATFTVSLPAIAAPLESNVPTSQQAS